MQAYTASNVKAKFHYASRFEAGLKLVADMFEAGRRLASNLSATSFEPASVMEFGFKLVCCQHKLVKRLMISFIHYTMAAL